MFRRNNQVHQTRDLSELLGCYVQAGGHGQKAAQLARGAGIMVRKSDVPGTTLDDVAGIGQGLSDSFFASLQHAGGVFDLVAARGRRAQLRTRAFIPESPIVAEVVGEGLAVPVSRFTLDAEGLVPVKIAGMAVSSIEAMATPEGQDALATELLEAVTVATDSAFLAQLSADAAFTDDLSGDPLANIKLLLDAVSLSGRGDLVFVISPTLANAYATYQTDGLLTFPDIGPNGGTLCGVETLVSAGSPGLVLIDAQAILTGAQGIEFRFSTSALVELNTEPAMSSGVPTAPSGKAVSLFQVDGIGVVAQRTIASKTVRASGVGILTPPETT